MAEQVEITQDKENGSQDAEAFPGASWVNSWWQSAKEKSSSALEFMKKDLSEFSQVVKEDTVSAISTTSALVKEKLNVKLFVSRNGPNTVKGKIVDSDESVAGRARIGLTTLVHSVSGAFYPINEPEENEVLLIHNSQPIRLDNWESELQKIKIEFGTFCHEPDGPPELYEKWLESFQIESHSDEISQILVDNPETRQIYSKLVPAAISNAEFWQRYFYRVHQLKEKETRRAELVKRVDIDKIEDLAWEDEDEATQFHKEKESVAVTTSITTTPKSLLSKSPELIVNVSSVEVEKAQNDSSKEYLNLEDAKTSDFIEKQTTSSDASLAASNSSDKDGTTGDEWEKDFEAEMSDFIQKEAELFAASEEPKITQQDEDWEKWE